MPKGEKDTPELVRAAQALENEIVRLETLSRSVRKIRLDSEKNILRAAKELSEALTLPDRLAEGLRAFTRAMDQMQMRQQAALEPLGTSATEIQQRTQRLSEHMQAFAVLGKAAGEVTALLQPDNGSPHAPLSEVEARLGAIVEGSRILHDAARADDFPDVAR